MTPPIRELLGAIAFRAAERVLGEDRAALLVFGLTAVEVALVGDEADVANLGIALAGAPCA